MEKVKLLFALLIAAQVVLLLVFLDMEMRKDERLLDSLPPPGATGSPQIPGGSPPPPVGSPQIHGGSPQAHVVSPQGAPLEAKLATVGKQEDAIIAKLDGRGAALVKGEELLPLGLLMDITGHYRKCEKPVARALDREPRSGALLLLAAQIAIDRAVQESQPASLARARALFRKIPPEALAAAALYQNVKARLAFLDGDLDGACLAMEKTAALEMGAYRNFATEVAGFIRLRQNRPEEGGALLEAAFREDRKGDRGRLIAEDIVVPLKLSLGRRLALEEIYPEAFSPEGRGEERFETLRKAALVARGIDGESRREAVAAAQSLLDAFDDDETYYFWRKRLVNPIVKASLAVAQGDMHASLGDAVNARRRYEQARLWDPANPLAANRLRARP